MGLPTYEERQLERIRRAELKDEARKREERAEREAVKRLWTNPDFQRVLEHWDRRHDVGFLLRIDPTRPGWEAEFIGLQRSIKAYWATREAWVKMVTTEGQP